MEWNGMKPNPSEGHSQTLGLLQLSYRTSGQSSSLAFECRERTAHLVHLSPAHECQVPYAALHVIAEQSPQRRQRVAPLQISIPRILKGSKNEKQLNLNGNNGLNVCWGLRWLQCQCGGTFLIH
eukprot:scaffold54873_cov33-Prasinocladus_malaysianus.AAC.1